MANEAASEHKPSWSCPGSGFLNVTTNTSINIPYKDSLNCTWFLQNPNFASRKLRITFEAFNVSNYGI